MVVIGNKIRCRVKLILWISSVIVLIPVKRPGRRYTPWEEYYLFTECAKKVKEEMGQFKEEKMRRSAPAKDKNNEKQGG